MEVRQSAGKTALALAVGCLLAATLMFRTSGAGFYAMLFVGAVVGGTVAALVAVISSSRPEQSVWIRRASAGVLVCFLGLLAWGAYIATQVPLS